MSGIEVWTRAQQARSVIGAATASAAFLAAFDGYWAAAGKGFWTPGSDIAIAMVVGTVIAVALGILSFWRDAPYALARIARHNGAGHRPKLLEGPGR
jgi:hypothetical protein